MEGPGFDGLLVLDKPVRLTSRDAVNRALGWFPRRTRIGHTGTLDPLATGVLVLCIGQATRLCEYVQDMPKVYAASVKLGAVSPTDDADGIVTPMLDAAVPTRAKVMEALQSFVGEIEQVPPVYSAAMIDGRRAYDLARKGQEVSLASRKVTIDAIDVLAYSYPDLEIEVHCSKGTYIRSLTRDLGQRLGCGGYITALRRLEVGCFHVQDAISLDLDPASARQRLLPLSCAVRDLLPITLSVSEATRLLHGQWVPSPIALSAERTEAAIFDDAGRLLAITEIDEGWLHAKKSLAGAPGI